MTPLQRVQEKFSQEIIETHAFRGDETVIIRPGALRAVAQFLKETAELDFNFLMDLSAVDYLNFGDARLPSGEKIGGQGKTKKEVRFEVVYHFYSLKQNQRLRLKVPVDDKNPEIDTLCDLWPSANWYEREVWDMFGIRFRGHPNLKRILMYEEFQGHALRKDYPFNKRQPLIGPPN